MTTQAYFEDIQTHILRELRQTKHSIRLAVAWFTDPSLFEVLCQKAALGFSVELLLANHSINHQSNLPYKKLQEAGGKVWWIGNGSDQAPLMHNKFCIIDRRVLVFGSYNWTRRAQTNHESITVIEDHPPLIQDFDAEFDKIKAQYFPVTDVDWGKLRIRLDTLLNVIRLEDVDDVQYQAAKIQKLLPSQATDARVERIRRALGLTQSGQYAQAVDVLNDLLRQLSQVVAYIDPEISALQLEIRGLEWQVASLEDEKTEIEKLIHAFEVRHTLELGALILQLLLLRKRLADEAARENPNQQAEADEAQRDYDDYRQSVPDVPPAPLRVLTSDEQQALKSKFRQASKLCHPDKVPDAQKAQAERVFQDLKTAYAANDLNRVEALLRDLERGVFASRGETLTRRDQLQSTHQALRHRRDELEATLQVLKGSEAYQKIAQLTDWDAYFSNTKAQLEQQLNSLQYQLS